jgi:hypothetical protein
LVEARRLGIGFAALARISHAGERERVTAKN